MTSKSKEYSNDLGTVKIHGIGTKNPGFASFNESFDDYSTQFNEFDCRELSFVDFSGSQRLDLSKIARPELVWRAQLQLHGKGTAVILPDNPGQAFRNLVELKIGDLPKHFFSFPTLRALKVLDVTFDAKACMNLPLLFAFLKPAWLSCLFRRGSRPFCFKLHGAHVTKT
jgi:hypothetical protein